VNKGINLCELDELRELEIKRLFRVKSKRFFPTKYTKEEIVRKFRHGGRRERGMSENFTTDKDCVSPSQAGA
jgi:hypothetical protein